MNKEEQRAELRWFSLEKILVKLIKAPKTGGRSALEQLPFHWLVYLNGSKKRVLLPALLRDNGFTMQQIAEAIWALKEQGYKVESSLIYSDIKDIMRDKDLFVQHTTLQLNEILKVRDCKSGYALSLPQKYRHLNLYDKPAQVKAETAKLSDIFNADDLAEFEEADFT